MEYLSEDAKDIEWIVHRAGIGSDGPSEGMTRARERSTVLLHFGIVRPTISELSRRKMRFISVIIVIMHEVPFQFAGECSKRPDGSSILN